MTSVIYKISITLLSYSGRTVVATIHQPSSAVFEMFDDLILLKKGVSPRLFVSSFKSILSNAGSSLFAKGNVVFFGELGESSNKMVQYFEERGAKPIERQENPAAWVLRAYAGEHTSNDADWAELYKSSDQFNVVREQIESLRGSTDTKKELAFSSTYSTPIRERVRLMCSRMLTIYRRSWVTTFCSHIAFSYAHKVQHCSCLFQTTIQHDSNCDRYSVRVPTWICFYKHSLETS